MPTVTDFPSVTATTFHVPILSALTGVLGGLESVVKDDAAIAPTAAVGEVAVDSIATTLTSGPPTSLGSLNTASETGGSGMIIVAGLRGALPRA